MSTSRSPQPPDAPHQPSPRTAPLHFGQQRKIAKDLLRAAAAGSPEALARLRAVRTDAGEPARELKLADAQLAVAREAGFPSWPKLVAGLKERDLAAFRDAVRRRDLPQVAREAAQADDLITHGGERGRLAGQDVILEAVDVRLESG